MGIQKKLVLIHFSISAACLPKPSICISLLTAFLDSQVPSQPDLTGHSHGSNATASEHFFFKALQI